MFNLFDLFKIKRYSDISDIMKEEAVIAKSYEDILIEKIIEQLYTARIYSVSNKDGLNFLIEDGRETFSYWITLKDNLLTFNLGKAGIKEYKLKDSSLYNKRMEEYNIVENNNVIKSLEEIKSWLTYVNRT